MSEIATSPGAVPLALVHTVLSSLRYVAHVEPPGTALLGGLAVFAVVEFLLLRRRGDGSSSPHLALVAAGTATALVIALA